MMPTLFVSGFVAIAAAVAMWEMRRWALSWGASREELAGVWPGDELSPNATEITTRALWRAFKIVWRQRCAASFSRGPSLLLYVVSHFNWGY